MKTLPSVNFAIGRPWPHVWPAPSSPPDRTSGRARKDFPLLVVYTSNRFKPTDPSLSKPISPTSRVSAQGDARQQDADLSAAYGGERGRLRNFLRRRLLDDADVDDMLQDVFCELIEMVRMMQPVEQAGAWLFRVARNRIADRFRSTRRSETNGSTGEDAAESALEGLFSARIDDPERAYWLGELRAELDAAITGLPVAEREAFVAHAIDGSSFKDLAARTGFSVNALTLRKHQAVKRLRQRLRNLETDSFHEA